MGIFGKKSLFLRSGSLLHDFARLLDVLLGLVTLKSRSVYISTAVQPMTIRMLGNSPKLCTLDVHIRLTDSKWVDVGLGVQVGKTVVDETVRRLIATNCIDNIK